MGISQATLNRQIKNGTIPIEKEIKYNEEKLREFLKYAEQKKAELLKENEYLVCSINNLKNEFRDLEDKKHAERLLEYQTKNRVTKNKLIDVESKKY